jgi:hypothetical protein
LLETGSRITVNEFSSLWKGLSDKVIKSSGDSIWSKNSYNQKFLEWHLIEFLPLKRKFLVLRSKLIIPVFESVWSLLLKLLNEVFKSFNFIEFLETVPSEIR